MVALSTGKYELTREKVEFSQYMREEGYHIIPIKPEHQLVSPILEQAGFAHPHCMVVVVTTRLLLLNSCVSAPATTCVFLGVELEVTDTDVGCALHCSCMGVTCSTWETAASSLSMLTLAARLSKTLTSMVMSKSLTTHQLLPCMEQCIAAARWSEDCQAASKTRWCRMHLERVGNLSRVVSCS